MPHFDVITQRGKWHWLKASDFAEAEEAADRKWPGWQELKYLDPNDARKDKTINKGVYNGR